jgi:ABC-2 type transport system permease protein
MTTATLTLTPPSPGAGPAPALVDRPPSRVPTLLRSEWLKLRTVRSTYWSLLVAVVAVVAMVGASAIVSLTHKAGTALANPTSSILVGVLFAQLAIGVVGVMSVTSEYSTGMIRSTFVAAPQRRSVIAAKAAVFAGVALVVGLVASFISFFVGQALLSSHGITISLSSPGALRSVIGVGLYLGLLGVFAVGLGTIIRSSAGAIAALFGIVLVLPAVLQALPSSIRDGVGKFLPSNAGQAIFHAGGTPSLSPWVGLGVFALFCSAVFGLALTMVRRRDS